MLRKVCESSSRSANVCLSDCQSVSQSVTLIFLSDLLVYFKIVNRTEIKLRQSLINPRQNYDNKRILELLKLSQPQVL